MDAIELTGKIVKIDLLKNDPVPVPVKPAPVVMNETIPRPRILNGRTFKVTSGDHNIYVTINEIVLNAGTEDEFVQPFELFINGRNMQHFQWVSALSLLISGIFRKGGDPWFMVAELKQVVDPNGGEWINGVFQPSAVAQIGAVIEEYLNGLYPVAVPADPLPVPELAPIPAYASRPKPGQCLKCGEYAMQQQEGCPTCTNCGYSKCG